MRDIKLKLENDFMISFCLTNYNRCDLLYEAIDGLLDDDRVSEIIISDDFSDYYIFNQVLQYCSGKHKIKIFRNQENIGMSRNKAKAISRASEEWVLIGDSDNMFTSQYLDHLPTKLQSNIIYCPSFAKPNFDYRKYAGMTFDKNNIKRLLHEPMINCLLNTCNYVVHRRSYLETYIYNEEHVASDTIWFNYNWLKNGGELHVVPEMHYFHRVHKEAGFNKNIQYNMKKADEVLKKILHL